MDFEIVGILAGTRDEPLALIHSETIDVWARRARIEQQMVEVMTHEHDPSAPSSAAWLEARLAALEAKIKVLVRIIEERWPECVGADGCRPHDAMTAACRDPRSAALAAALRAPTFSGACRR